MDFQLATMGYHSPLRALGANSILDTLFLSNFFSIKFNAEGLI